eukprot:1194933-Prorocentrum_minimum.AAC.2
MGVNVRSGVLRAPLPLLAQEDPDLTGVNLQHATVWETTGGGCTVSSVLKSLPMEYLTGNPESVTHLRQRVRSARLLIRPHHGASILPKLKMALEIRLTSAFAEYSPRRNGEGSQVDG